MPAWFGTSRLYLVLDDSLAKVSIIGRFVGLLLVASALLLASLHAFQRKRRGDHWATEEQECGPSDANDVVAAAARVVSDVEGNAPAKSTTELTVALLPAAKRRGGRSDDHAVGAPRMSKPETVKRPPREEMLELHQANGAVLMEQAKWQPREEVPDLDLAKGFMQICQYCSAHPALLDRIRRAVRLLRLCSYPLDDICAVMAHASVYFDDLRQQLNTKSPAETGNVIALLMFVAHSYVEDETCPLAVWHQHLFTGYCSVKTLNKVVMQMFESRGYRLWVAEAEVLERHARLLASTACCC